MAGQRPRRGGLTRRDFLVVSGGATAGLILSSCGGGASDNPAVSGNQGSNTGGASYDGPKVELAFWNGFTGGDGPYMKDLVEQFSSENDSIDVKMIVQEWVDFYQKVPQAVASGSGPDVAIMHIDQ